MRNLHAHSGSRRSASSSSSTHTHPLRHCFRKFTDPWPLFPVLALTQMANLLLRQTKIPKQLSKGKCKNTSWGTKVEYPITKSSARCPVPPRFGYPSPLAILLAGQPVRAPVLSMKPVTHALATTSIPASIFCALSRYLSAISRSRWQTSCVSPSSIIASSKHVAKWSEMFRLAQHPDILLMNHLIYLLVLRSTSSTCLSPREGGERGEDRRDCSSGPCCGDVGGLSEFGQRHTSGKGFGRGPMW